ncbi:MAG: glycoside hydrolase family 108 protein [Phenylobacterium sp.]|uniref:glycoside hydrolase family 108 protein n=1 Tax=Phenylobacterium sp. TaxID=1871053 RepID=UPI00391A078D
MNTPASKFVPAQVEEVIDRLVGREGKYSNHPSDRGGETMWGITVATARRYGYAGSMRDMPRAEAVRIYRERYWKEPGFEAVAYLSLPIAEELLDTGVNLGVAWPGIYLQTALNRFNRRGRDYPNIKIDGDVGPITLRTLSTYLKIRRDQDGESVMLKALNIQQGARYFDITPEDAANEDFFFGWIRHRIGALA